MRIQSNLRFIHDPILHYKLDPGEPGLASPKHASESIAAVATHEASNILRFRKDAINKGGYVVDSFIGLNLQFKGSFLAAVSGKSKALVIIPEDSPYKKIIHKNQPEINKIIPNDNEVDSNNNQKKDNINKDSTDIEDTLNKNVSFNNLGMITEEITIDNEIQKSQENKERLLQQIKNDEENSITNDNKSNNIDLKERLRRLQAKIELLKLKKELKKQESLINLFGSQTNLPLNIILSKYKGNFSIDNPSIDLNI